MKKGTVALKITGLLINVIGYTCYLLTLANKTIVHGANYAIKTVQEYGIDNIINAKPGNNVFNTLNQYWHIVIALIIITMGIVLIYEIVNYVLYLKNNKKALTIALVIETVAFVILCVLRAFNIVHFQTFAFIIPISTGLIKLLLLKLNTK